MQPTKLKWKRTHNFGFGSLMIRDRFCSGSEYFKKIRFVFSSSSVNVGFRLGSSLMELERCFHGGHLLWINCNCKYQLID